MDSQNAINILVAINLLVSMSANFSGARKGLKISITKVIERPVTFLQAFPPNVAALVLVLTILSIFDIGTLPAEYETKFYTLRIAGLIMFFVFSWLQVVSYKSLKNSYAQEVVIMKDHKLITSGIYKFIRHPQYISQLLSDLGAGLALLSFIVVPVVVLIELPLFIMRAVLEDKLLQKHFGEEYSSYKKRSGFIIPFIG
ncbi:MAG: isoprenylcysteine carboxylmethyltransferase family protein [Ignavibacteriales bacterium]|nr:isoprenylcysteine carboxylmethyltransferase family protein [Ignavibacteriales bacterium]